MDAVGRRELQHPGKRLLRPPDLVDLVVAEREPIEGRAAKHERETEDDERQGFESPVRRFGRRGAVVLRAGDWRVLRGLQFLDARPLTWKAGRPSR